MKAVMEAFSAIALMLPVLVGGASCDSDNLLGECTSSWTSPSAIAASAAAPAATGALSEARLSLLDVFREHGASSEVKKECGKAWQSAVSDLLARLGVDGAMQVVGQSHGYQRRKPGRLLKAANCWHAKHSGLSWAECCANVNGLNGKAACFADAASPGYEACCAFTEGSDSFLKIPALMEVRVMVGLPDGRLLRIEQDGFLRPFDVATVLWPGGYLLARWAGAPERCTWWRGRRVLELGAGVGAASIAAAGCGASVVATDLPDYALLLLTANAVLNDVEVTVRRLDWHNDTDVAALRALGPYDAVIGASLFYEKWYARLWSLLEELTRPEPGRTSNEKPLIALSHMTGSLSQPPKDSHIVEESRLHGEGFGMGRPDRGYEYADADFEVVLLHYM